jgi:hypothetical protein
MHFENAYASGMERMSTDGYGLITWTLLLESILTATVEAVASKGFNLSLIFRRMHVRGQKAPASATSWPTWPYRMRTE